MPLFLKKLLWKDKLVKVYLYDKDNRIKSYYIKLKGNYVEIDNHSYTINKKEAFYEKGIPTFTYSKDDIKPFNPYEGVKAYEGISSEELNTALNAEFSKELFEAGKEKGSNVNLGLISLIISVAGFFALGYVLMEEINKLGMRMDDLARVIEILGR